jgi:hypothetical protein
MRKIKIIIFGWTILSFLIDLYMLIISKNISAFGISALGLELLVCRISFKMFDNNQWSIILMSIYYGLRSFNIYTEHFTLFTKSGLNIEIGIGSYASINLISLLLFILLILSSMRQKKIVSSIKMELSEF